MTTAEKASLCAAGVPVCVTAHGWHGVAYGEVYANDDTATIYIDWYGKELTMIVPWSAFAHHLTYTEGDE